MKILIRQVLASAALFGTLLSAAGKGKQATAPPPPQAGPTPAAQTPGTQNVPPTNEPARRGGFVPGQKRPPEDPAQVARGKTLFAINCRGCHGADLRGGDLGGPNLLRSQLALSDRAGELIVPVIHGSRQSMGMPAIGLSDADANATASYVRSVIETIQGQGAPPSAGREAPSVLVGNANEGKAYFAVKCSACHSATGDLSKIGERIADPKKLQNAWLAGGTREEEEEAPGAQPGPRTVMATVTSASGESAEGRLVRVDEFLVTIRLPDGTDRTFRRNGDEPSVAIRDPLKGHRDLLPQYSDRDIHDVTAYLVTLK